jgi:hypothetical protein
MKASCRGVRTSLARIEDMSGLLREQEKSAHCQVLGFMKRVQCTPVIGTSILMAAWNRGTLLPNPLPSLPRRQP